jgi:hypothetical protein
MYRKSARYKRLIIGILLIISLVIVFQFKRWTFFSPGRQAKEVVEQFYHYEQEGDFSKSWELFHPVMKEKFTKSNYLQVRAHVFMQDFGVDTFTYKVQKPEELKNWKMSKTGPFMKIVYKVLISQNYKGKFGNFEVIQEVFVVKDKGEWKVVWDYNQ